MSAAGPSQPHLWQLHKTPHKSEECSFLPSFRHRAWASCRGSMPSLWKAKGNFASLSYDPGDRTKDLLQSSSCSCCVQLEKGSNATCVGAGRQSNREDPEASARHSFHYQNEIIPCPAGWRRKDRSKANNRRGCREEEPSPQDAETSYTPVTPASFSVCSYAAANMEKSSQLWGAPGSSLREILETNTDQRETPSCIHSWGCLPLLKGVGHVGFNCKLFVCACT